MAEYTTPKHCPKCRIEWTGAPSNVEKVAEAKPAADGRPAVGPRYRCLACLHRWTVLD